MNTDNHATALKMKADVANGSSHASNYGAIGKDRVLAPVSPDTRIKRLVERTDHPSSKFRA